MLSIMLAVLIARRNETRMERFEDVLMAVGAGAHDLRVVDGATTTSAGWPVG